MPAGRPHRLLLTTSAYPDAETPLNAPWNAWQMEALREAGCTTKVFLPVTWVPRVLAGFSARFRRKAFAPREREWHGISISSPRVPMGFQWARRQSWKRPRLVAEAMRRLVEPVLKREIKAWRPDGIVVQGGFPWGNPVSRAARPLGIPFIMVEHSMYDLVKMERSPRLLAYYREAAEAAEAVVVVGPQMLAVARDRLRLPRVVLVPNGAMPPTPEMLRAARPEALRDRFVISCVANYIRKKGMEELVEAFERVAAARTDAMLVIATKAPETLRARVAASPLRDRIDLRGPMPNEDVRQLMVWSDLFAMISWEEAFGIVYAEALMAGCPVLMTRECGAAEFIPVAPPGEAGADSVGMVIEARSVDAAEQALRWAMDDRARLREMGRHGTIWAESTLSWRRHAEGLLATFGARNVV